MKIRSGFVSNSSSSSFIAFGKPLHVCEAMLELIRKDDGMDKNSIDIVIKAFDKCRSNVDVISGRYGLSFNSGGYDVKIHMKDNSTSYVYSSNYHSWGTAVIIDEPQDNVDDILIGLSFIWLPTLQIYKNDLVSIYNKHLICPNCKNRCYSAYSDRDGKFLICQECKGILGAKDVLEG